MRIEELDEIAKKYVNFEKDPSEENFRQMLLCIIGFQNQNDDIFKEWYEQIQMNQETGQIGKLFASKYDFYQARSDTSILLKILESIKEKFPDPRNIFRLEDFNRLSSRVDINTQTKRFTNIKNNPEQFVQSVFQQMFGYINRRENISSLVAVIKSLKMPVEVSSRFLLNLVLQNSDIELRTRIIHYQSEYFSVPLIMNCQSSFQSGNYNLKYMPEVVFNMLEGIGIFNFSAGKRCIHPVGKSQLLNDLLYPTAEFSHEAFEQQDKNLFSSGQVDVFFEKSFDVQRDFVLIDGQGLLKQEAIESALILTNIALINFHFKDLLEESILDDLKNKIRLIRNAENFDNKIMIILVIRDATDTRVLKQNSREKIGDTYEQLQKFENDIDQAIQLMNMSVLQKMERIEELKPMLFLFYKAIESMNVNKQQFKFTKKNFVDNFISQDKSEGSKSQTIKEIIEKSNEFIFEVSKIKENIFQRNALPLLDVQNKLRQKIIQKRQTVQNDEQLLEEIERQNELELKSLYDQKKQIIPSDILRKFKELVLDKNSSIIFSDIAKNLRKITFENIKNPKRIKMDIIEKQKEEAKKDHQFSQQQKDERLKRFHQQIAEIDSEIYQKSISLEYFWRCLIYYLDKDTDFKEWNEGHHRKSIISCIENQIKNGDCFELIDGENLEFKGLLIQEVVKFSQNDKVIVVCVIGPQSSGKSTLLNFAFGTQFFTSTGRCTKGIYFTLQKFPDDLPNKAGVKWLIMLDTEGLQSPERIDDEYDRKIVLFAMLSSDVLIINNRGEIHATMINTLKVCCVTYDDIQQLGNRPEIIYTYGQNAVKDKEPFKIQVQDLKTKVIEAKMDSNTIEKTAEDLLGYNDDKINVFGYAYKNEIIERDDSKGLIQDVTFKINVTQFGVETARILEIICRVVNDESKNFKDIQLWISDSKKNWDLIDRFCKNIVQYQDLSQFIVNKKVMDFMNNQWNSYIINQNVYVNDELKCNNEVKNLFETFKKHGQVALSKEQNEIEQQNSYQKDQDLQNYVLAIYDKWKKEPEQASITAQIELKYLRAIRAKNEVLKDQFTLLLKNRLQELKMIHMSKNGIKVVQLKAIELMRSEEFQQRTENEKQQILKQEFEQAFNKILSECKDKKALQQIKKNYFINLVKSFGIINQFILPISDEEYHQLEEKIEEELKDHNSKNSLGLENFLVFKMNEPDKYYQTNLSESLFTFNNDYILQIPDDPKDRIFDPKKQENFLELKNLIMCEFTYQISSDLGRDLDRKNLFEAIMGQLQLKKAEKKEVKKYNFYGEYYKENLQIEVDDQNAQMSQIRYLFSHLQEAGFRIRIKSKKGEYIGDLLDIDLKREFEEFGKNHVYDQKKKNYESKRQWAQDVSDHLLFERSCFKKLNNTILYLFKSKSVVIKNCNSPFETFSQHQQKDYELKLAAYVSAPKINYIKSLKCNQMKEQDFQILVKPKSTDDHLLTKYNKLSRIAFRNLQWHKIAQHIITSVRELMKLDSDSQQIQNQNVDLDELIKLNTFTSNQIKNLESKYLNTQLKDVLNDELNKKLCLYISKDFDAKISWCAIFVCWVELYKKAENLFDSQYEHLLKQKSQIENEFHKIVNGKTDEITVISTKQLVEDSIKMYLDEVKSQTTQQIINKDLNSINSQFDTIELYKNLDTKYLKQQLSAEYTVQQFLQYVEKPNEMFEHEVKEMYSNIIKPIFQRQSINVQNTINEALNAFKKLLMKIDYQLFSFNDWNMVTIEKYFDIEDENGQSIDNKHLQDISSFFSPVIFEVLIRIMVGSFDMNKFQFSITNKQNIQANYWFQPKQEDEGGPLQVFADKNFQSSIINFHRDLDQAQSELIGLIIQQFKNFQHSKTYEIFEINKAFKQMQITLQTKTDDFFRNPRDFDENDFNCKDAIDGLMQNAIGCTQRCQYCNRKCELQEHSPQNGVNHSCQKMGHQMRVFAGGHFVNTRSKKIPSLFTCDIIDPNTKIMVDGKMFFWKEILAAELKDWTITFEKDKEEQIDRKKIFDKFWIMVGQKYCADNGYEYIEKNDNIAEGNQMHESEVIAIALDGSGSMTGQPWNSVVAGAKQLINHIKANHVDRRKVRFIAIVFNDNASILYDGDIDGNTENIWNFPSGGTNFDPPLSLGMQSLSAHIGNKDLAKFYFFTDGEADYPQTAVQSIQSQLSGNKWTDQKTKQLKLRICLFCSNDRNKNMELVRDNLNKFSNQHFRVDVCDLKQNIDVNRLGEQMIEIFQFNKLLDQE